MDSFLKSLYRRNTLAERHTLAQLPQILAAHNRDLRRKVFPHIAISMVGIAAIGAAGDINTKTTIVFYLMFASATAVVYCYVIWKSFPVYQSPFVHVGDWRQQFKNAAPILGAPYLLFLRSFENKRTLEGPIILEQGDTFIVVGPDDALVALGLGGVTVGVKHPLIRSENEVIPILPILHDDWKIDVEWLIVNARFIVVAIEEWGEGIAAEFALIEKHNRQATTLIIKSRRRLPVAINGFSVVERRDVFPDTRFSAKDLISEYAVELARHIPFAELRTDVVVGLRPAPSD